MKNILKISILTLIIGLSSCTGFYIRDNVRYIGDYIYPNKYSIYNPYYYNYHTVTVIKPINYGHWNYPIKYYHTPKINYNQYYGHRNR